MRSQDGTCIAVESLIDIAELNADKIKTLRVSAVVGQGEAARSYMLLKNLDGFLHVRRIFGKVRRRIGL